MAKYKVGDKVRIVSERPDSRSYVDEMVRFLGKEITISMVEEFRGIPYYYSEDATPKDQTQKCFCKWLGVPGYYFRDEWISGLAEQKKPTDENLSVTIRFCGRMTVAELYKNGRVVKVENARCNPKDEYSRAEGARIAVERLFRKNVASSKNKVRSDDDIASGIAAGVREANKPKIGDKFVVISNKSPDCIHHFKIGSVVTLKYIGITENRYEANNGMTQIVRDCDVAPYREKAK
uniref:Uncharacterized protein n=1 Tax=Siphoviridae sp. ct3pR10 TaxID=2826284 RepID=A0A8S5LWK5_9CAUD|nr:MAG TPA: hypothetical protein [Siphoviridae sp. ct3pR10]